MSEQIKSCPFCEAAGKIIKTVKTKLHGDIPVTATCGDPDCPVSSTEFLFAEWNTRPTESALLAALKVARHHLMSAPSTDWFYQDHPDEAEAIDAAIQLAGG